jgi:CheY-like chemotaxis protein
MSDELHQAEGAANWKILLVDDEPEVHEVSRLILGDVEFEGRGIDLLCAESATQAREMLLRHDDVALVLLDVVMETDDAGLALVHHIRDQILNRDVQIVLRTGQPGMAPELDVVMRYEINGYCLKTDVTAQRLHSMVISARVRSAVRGTRRLRSTTRPAAPWRSSSFRTGTVAPS